MVYMLNKTEKNKNWFTYKTKLTAYKEKMHISIQGPSFNLAQK